MAASDFRGDEVRLDADTTKNGDGRVSPMTHDLRSLLQAQLAEYEARRKTDRVPWVFVRMVARWRRADSVIFGSRLR